MSSSQRGEIWKHSSLITASSQYHGESSSQQLAKSPPPIPKPLKGAAYFTFNWSYKAPFFSTTHHSSTSKTFSNKNKSKIFFEKSFQERADHHNDNHPDAITSIRIFARPCGKTFSNETIFLQPPPQSSPHKRTFELKTKIPDYTKH